jgi:hypothetical protein
MNCRSCGAAIIWAVTETGKRMPVDAIPSDAGNILLADGIAVIAKNDDTAADNELHTSHFATCPHAAQHRKARP